VGVSIDTGTGAARAFRWSAPGGPQPIAGPPDAMFMYGNGVSGDGAVAVGELHSPAGGDAFRWTPAGGLVMLGRLTNGVYAQATAVSFDGLTVVGEADLNSLASRRAFRWTQAVGMTDLGLLPGANEARALAVNADGSAVTGVMGFMDPGGPGGSWRRMFRWTAAQGLEYISPVSTGYALGQGINADGTVVVGVADGAAVIWRAGAGLTNLQQYLTAQGTSLSGWTLQDATAITPDGSAIIGNGTYQGASQGWIVHFPRCGTSDFNGDGDFGTDQDIEAFFACLAGSCCGTCWPGGSDFNADGDFGTDQDIEAFFRVLAGANC
jgi:probable HAF family extracellular repeat protein